MTEPVDRRGMLKAAAAAATAAATLGGAESVAAQQQQPQQQPQPASAREYYELRTYHMRTGPAVAALGNYFRDALVPALRRIGTGPVGVFTVAIGPDAPSFYVLIPHRTMESVGTLHERLAADDEYRRAGAAVVDAPASSPAYERVESSLLVAFAGIPRLEVPPQTAAGGRRLFELRRYESHSQKASRTKIDVFNRSEIAIFRRAGMHPVFFGQTVVGGRMPNLTYLLAFDDMRARDAAWSAFGSDPEWRAIAAKPELSDAAIVSSISNVFLRPTAYSQI